MQTMVATNETPILGFWTNKSGSGKSISEI